MSLCDCRGIFANGKEVTRRRSGAASRGSDEAIRRNDRQACRRINQRFLKAPRQKSHERLFHSSRNMRMVSS